MSLIIDKEIDLSKEDLLTTKVYADTLKDLISNAPQEEPLTIGLFGPWGSGKSSIITTLKNEIGVNLYEEKANQSDTPEKTTHQLGSRIAFVIYDAWKYANDSFRRTFILTLQKDLGVKETLDMKNFYKSSNAETSVSFQPNKPFLYLALFFLLAGIFRFYANPSPTADWPIAAIAAFLSYTTGVLAKMFLELKTSVQSPIMTAPELFERCFNDLIESALSPVTLKKGRCEADEAIPPRYDKIVIVIDNIDRCSTESAYELLTNTKNFINSNHQVVFLIPMDDDALKKHLFKSDVIAGDQAEEFLRKYFNVVVRMKEFRNTEIFDFANKLNEKYKLGLKKDTVNIIAREYAKNPRRIIQFYNNLTSELATMTLKHRKAFRDAKEAAICKFLIIREQWPERFKEICNHPRAFLEHNPMSDVDVKLNHKKAVSAPDSYEKFLESTYVSTRNLKLEDLLKILLNADNYEAFPDSLALAAANGDWIEIQAALSEEDFTEDKVVNSLLFKLGSAVENELFYTDVSDILNQLMGFLLASPNPDKTDLERIEYATGKHLGKIISSARSFERLAKFNQLALKEKLNFIDQHISGHFKDFMPLPEDEFSDSDFQMYHSYLKEANEQQTEHASGFFTKFLKARKYDDRIIDDLRQPQFEILYDLWVLQDVFFEADTPVWLDHNFNHWMIFLKKLTNIKPLVKLLLDNAGRNLNSNPEGADLYIKKFRELLGMIPSEFEDPESAEQLHRINDFIFISPPGKTGFIKSLPAESRPELFRYLMESFRFTRASRSSSGWVNEFFRHELLPPYARSLTLFINQHKETLDFSLLKSLATSVQYVDEDIYYLHMSMLYLKVDGTDMFSDSEIGAVMDDLINNLSNYEEYAGHLKAHMKQPRAREIMREKVDTMSEEEIKAKPKAFHEIVHILPGKKK